MTSTIHPRVVVDDAAAAIDFYVTASVALDSCGSPSRPARWSMPKRREGRLRDPAGHLWIVSQHLEELTDDEIARRLDAG